MVRRARFVLALPSLLALAVCGACGDGTAAAHAGPTLVGGRGSGASGSGSPSPSGVTGVTGVTGTPGATGVAGGRRFVVVLDPGHNGGNATHPEQVTRLVPAGFGQRKACNTVGAETRGGYPEHAFTFDVTTRVRALLAADGVDVRMTRPDDRGVGPCVDARAAYGNARHADAVVSIHADSSYTGHGFHVIEATRSSGGAGVAAASHRLAVAVHDQYLRRSGFVPATYLGHGGYNQRTDLGGLNLSARPTVLIECGNMLDTGDAARMTTPPGRQRVAQAIADGIRAYLAGGH